MQQGHNHMGFHLRLGSPVLLLAEPSRQWGPNEVNHLDIECYGIPWICQMNLTKYYKQLTHIYTYYIYI